MFYGRYDVKRVSLADRKVLSKAGKLWNRKCRVDCNLTPQPRLLKDVKLYIKPRKNSPTKIIEPPIWNPVER